MKTTFKRVFDELDDEMMGIENNSVCEDIDIDVEKIKGQVFMQLGEKEKKPRATKKVVAMLIAAVIVVCGAIGAYASGSVQYAFRDWLSGSLNASGLYDGGKIELQSGDDSLDISLLGITGDDEKIYASIEVRKKDGSAVIDEDYVHPFWVLDAPDTIEEDKRVLDYYSCRVSYTDKNGKSYTDTDGDGQKGWGATHFVKYSLSEDNRALRLYVYVLRSDADLKDGRMTVTSESFGAHKIYEVLDEYEIPGDWDSDAIEKRQAELHITEEDCFGIYEDGSYKYCYGEFARFELPFEMSFDLNYRSDNNIEKTLSAKDAPDFVEAIAGDTKMTITPFGIYLFGQCEVSTTFGDEWDKKDHEMDYHCFKDVVWDDTSKVVLSDGTVYYLFSYVNGYVEKIEKGGTEYYDEKFSLNYSSVIGAPFEPEYHVIDVREIQTVMINGDVVYSK